MELTGREFEALADHAGEAYLRYSFTKGTAQEVAFLVDVLQLRAGARILDVGCGPGRHSRALTAAGYEAVGVDISAGFLHAAGPGLWARGDARALPVRPASFDAAISICQGGFGLLGGDSDGTVVAEMAKSLRPGGRLAVTGFSAYFALRHLEDGDTFDASTGVNHERTAVRNPSAETREFDLWTTCFTPRELRLMAEAAGLAVEGLWSVAPGAFDRRPPELDHPEFLLAGLRVG